MKSFTKNSPGDKLFKIRERCNQEMETGGPLREIKKTGEKGVGHFWKATNSTSEEKIVWIGGAALSVKGIEKSSIQLQG